MHHPILKNALHLAIAVATTVTLSAAPALADILYVSTTGKNSNPCSLTQPCRTLQSAIGKTPAGGEVHVLDSGFYGNNATIKKSLTISGNGHTVMLGAPITIDKPDAVVTLRRLVLNGQGTTGRGVHINAAAAVHIEHCVVHSFAQTGIYLYKANANLFVNDTEARDNGSYGLWVDGGGSTKLSVDNSRFEHNASGIAAIVVESAIHRSVMSGNRVYGVRVSSGRMSVTSSTAANNQHGYNVNGDAKIALDSAVARGNTGNGLWVFYGTAVVSNSVLTHNNIGLRKEGAGTVLTRQNNTVTNNTVNVSGTLTPAGGI